ncbi:MAG: glycosyltransferase [Candidatus Aminicenantia bacterium]
MGWFLFLNPRILPSKLSCKNIPEISIIIPAKDEEENIGNLLKDLREQSIKIDEVIVVDDNSSDRTAEIARKFEVKLIKLREEPPQGWQGKTWACWNGVLQSRGRVILFLDADVRLSPTALELLVCLQKKMNCLISVWPYHKIGNWIENFSLLFNLLAFFPMGVSGVFKRRKPIGAFGPCIITSREHYQQTGGHFAVKESVVEDVMLGKIYSEKNIPVKNFAGGDSVKFRMYSKGLKSIIEGWGKNTALGASAIDFFSFAFLFLWIFGIVQSGFFMKMRDLGLSRALFLYILYFVQIYKVSKIAGSFSMISILFFPLHSLFFILVFISSIYQTFVLKKVKWKGRKVKVA